MQTLDADGFEVGVLPLLGHFHLDPTLFGNGLVELGDLVILRQVWVEILLAVELAVLSNVQVQRHRGLHRILEHLLVEHRQGARQPADHRIDMGVGVIPKRGGCSRENLAVGPQLDMGLQANHGFPCRLSCCVSHACRVQTR